MKDSTLYVRLRSWTWYNGLSDARPVRPTTVDRGLPAGYRPAPKRGVEPARHGARDGH